MKNSKIQKAIFGLLAMSMSLSSFAAVGGNSVGGGGTAVILPDDTVVLADAYVTTETQDPESAGVQIKLGKPLIEELRRARLFLKLHSGIERANDEKTGEHYHDPYADLFDSNIFDKKTIYILVDSAEQIPERCPYHKPKLKDIPEGAQVVPVGCTVGEHTFLVKDIFARMSVRQQALLILHERLQAEPLSSKWNSYAIISLITNGVNVGLARIDQEQKGVFVPWTDAEETKVAAMEKTAKEYNIAFARYPDAYIPHHTVTRLKNGGGVLVASDEKTIQLDPTSYVGVLVSVDDHTRLAKNAALASLSLMTAHHFVFEENALWNSNVFPDMDAATYSMRLVGSMSVPYGVKLGKNSSFVKNTVIGDDYWTSPFRFSVGEGASVSGSTFAVKSGGEPFLYQLNFQKDAKITGSKFDLSFTRRNQRIVFGTTLLPVVAPLKAVSSAALFATGAGFYGKAKVDGVPTQLFEANEQFWSKFMYGKIKINFGSIPESTNCKVKKHHKNKLELSMETLGSYCQAN